MIPKLFESTQMLKSTHQLAQAVKAAAASAACALALTGCDLAADIGKKAFAMFPEQTAQSQTLVIPPGYPVKIGGQPVPVFGFDKCPPPDPAMLTLTRAVANEGCVVIKQSATSVEVLAGLPEGGVRETWSVEREGDRTRLRRPNGELVVPAT